MFGRDVATLTKFIGPGQLAVELRAIPERTGYREQARSCTGGDQGVVKRSMGLAPFRSATGLVGADECSPLQDMVSRDHPRLPLHIAILHGPGQGCAFKVGAQFGELG